MLTRAEWAIAAKLLFVIGGVLLLIAVHNAATLPAGQFIYGRF